MKAYSLRDFRFSILYILDTSLVILNSITEIYFICHKVNLFKVYKSMIFSIFTVLCNHHYKLVLEHV